MKKKNLKKLLCTKKESDFHRNKPPQSSSLLEADIVRLVATIALQCGTLLLYRKLVRPPPAIIAAKSIALWSLAASVFRWPEVNVGAEKSQASRWHIIMRYALRLCGKFSRLLVLLLHICMCVSMHFLFKLNWLLLLRQPSLHTRFRSHNWKCATVAAIGIVDCYFCCCRLDVIKTFTLCSLYALFAHPIIFKSYSKLFLLTLFCVC